MFKNLHVETERLIVRPFTMDDVEPFQEFANRPEVLRYIPEDEITVEKVRRAFQRNIENYERDAPVQTNRITLAIEYKSDHRLIGWIGYGPLDFAPTDVEIYYGFSPEYWGQGLAAEAARRMLRYGFEDLGLDRVVAVVVPDNAASVKVIEKTGMIYQHAISDLPDEFKFFEGCRYYSLTVDEFRDLARGETG